MAIFNSYFDITRGYFLVISTRLPQASNNRYIGHKPESSYKRTWQSGACGAPPCMMVKPSSLWGYLIRYVCRCKTWVQQIGYWMLLVVCWYRNPKIFKG